MSLFDELKRRNVIRVAAGYVVLAWLVIQVAETILPFYGVPDTTIRLLITVLAVLFVPVVVLAWVFEWTPEGIKVDAGDEQRGPRVAAAAKRWDRVVMAVLVIAVAYFVVEKVISNVEAEPSIAVLPFNVLSTDDEHEYLAIGIAEDLRSMLAQIPELQVTWHVSSFSPRLEGLDIAEIAEQLAVAHLVTGTIRKQGESVRINTQLIDTRRDVVVWAETFDRQLDDFFEIQDEISKNIVAKLRLEVLGSAPAASGTDPEVLALIVQAAQVFFDGYGSGWKGMGDRMAALLDRAIELDPNYAPAYGWYIYAEGARLFAKEISQEEEMRRRTALVQKALALDPDEPMTLINLAWIEAYENGDPEAAAPLFERALRAGPDNGEVVRQVGRFAYQIDRYDDAIRLLERSAQLNPLCTSCIYALSRSYFVTGRFEEALAMRERYLLLMGDQNRAGYSQYGLMKLLVNDAEGALAIFDENMKIGGQDAVAGRAMALFSLGRIDESDRALAELPEVVDFRTLRSVLDVHAWRGELDKAFGLLYAYIADSSAEDFDGFWLLNWLRNPQFGELREDPRWDALRADIGWPLERTMAIDIELSPPD